VHEKFAFGGGINPFTDVDYDLDITGAEYTRKLRSTGGISVGNLGAAYRINSKIALGVNYKILFGKDDEVWIVDYDYGGYEDSKDELIKSQWGSGVSIGTLIDVTKRLKIGGVFVSKFNMNTTNKVNNYVRHAKVERQNEYYIYKTTTLSEEDFTIPCSYGLGVSLDINSRFSAAGDIYRWQMRNFKHSRAGIAVFNNSTRYSIGFEYDPEKGRTDIWYRKVDYRIGFYYWDLYSRDIDGSPLTEQFVTTGISLPFFGNFARIDIALEGGIRSSETKMFGSEKIIRLHFSFTGSERWFVR